MKRKNYYFYWTVLFLFILLNMSFLTGLSAQEWDVMYDANQYPDQATPSWDYTIWSGSPSRSISSGVLVQTSGEGTSYKYSRSLNANDEVGVTVETRVKVTGSDGMSFFIKISDGSYKTSLEIDALHDEVCISGSPDYDIDVSEYHTYKVTLQNGYAKLYIDGSTTPVLEANANTSSDNEIYFGKIFDSKSFILYMDYLYYKTSPASIVYSDYEELAALHPNHKVYASLSVATGTPIAWIGYDLELMVDLADLFGYSNDGIIIPGIQDDEWVTILLNHGISAGIGTNPNGAIVWSPGVSADVDEKDGLSVGFSAPILGVSIPLTIPPIPSITASTTAVSGSIGFGTIYSFEIRKSVFIDILLASQEGPFVQTDLLVNLMQDYIMNNAPLDMVFLPMEFNPAGNIRHYSVGNELPSSTLVNGNFESSGGWTTEAIGGGVAPTINLKANDGPYEGSYYAKITNTLGSTGIERAGFIRQTITIPDDATTLNYTIKAWQNSWGAPIGVKLGTTRLEYYPCDGVVRNIGWTHRSWDISEYRGQTVVLEIFLDDRLGKWSGYPDHGAWIGIDNVSISAKDFTDGENFDFESSGGWTPESIGGNVAPVIKLQATDVPYEGSYYAKITNTLGSTGIERAGFIRQTITIPDDATTLNYTIKAWQNSWGAPIGVKLGTTRLEYYPCDGVVHNIGWTHRSWDISEYIGQTVVLEIFLDDRLGKWSGYPDHGAWIGVDNISISTAKSGYSATVVTDIEPVVPDNYFSLKSYPNPFSSTVTIEYTLLESGNVSIKIYNIAGQLVSTLVNEEKPAGQHSVQWNCKDNNEQDVNAGIYFYRIETGKLTQTNKLLLMK